MEFSIGPQFSYEIATRENFLHYLSEDLNQAFATKNYGGNIERIYCSAICVSKGFEPFFKVRPPKLLRKEPALEFEYKLDFENYKQMTDEERKKYLVIEYLINIKKVLATKKIKNFDSVAFLQDLEAFFKDKGYIS